MENGSSFASSSGVGGESVDSGGDNLIETFRQKGVFESFGGSGLRGRFLFGGAFEDGVPCDHVLLGMVLLASKRLSANAGSFHHGSSLPG